MEHVSPPGPQLPRESNSPGAASAEPGKYLTGAEYEKYKEDRVARRLLVKLGAVGTVIATGLGWYLSNQLGETVRKEVNSALTTERLTPVVTATIALNEQLKQAVAERVNNVVREETKSLDSKADQAAAKAIADAVKQKTGDIEELVAKALTRETVSALVKKQLTESDAIKERLINDCLEMVRKKELSPVQRLNALTQLQLFGREDESNKLLWNLIEDEPDPRLRQGALQSLKPLGRNDAEAVDRILRAFEKDADLADRKGRPLNDPRIDYFVPRTAGGDLGEAYADCISHFKESALPAIGKWFRAHPGDGRGTVLAGALARIGGANALETLCWLAENSGQSAALELATWNGLASLKADALPAESRRKGFLYVWGSLPKDNKERARFIISFDPVSSSYGPTAALRPSGVISAIKEAEVLIEPDDEGPLYSVPKAKVLIQNPFVTQRVTIVLNNPTYSFNQQNALRNLLSAGGADDWKIVRDVMLGAPAGSGPGSFGKNYESALVLWLDVLERKARESSDPTALSGAKVSGERATLASELVDLVTSAEDCLTSQACRRALLMALRECGGEAVKSFFDRYPKLARRALAQKSGPNPDNMTSYASSVLEAAVARDDGGPRRLGLTHDLIRGCSSGGQTDWELAAAIAGALQAPIMAQDDRCTRFLYHCLSAVAVDNPSERRAARAALLTLRHVGKETVPEASDKVLSFLTAISADGAARPARVSDAELRLLRDTVTAALLAFCRENQTALIPKVRDSLRALQAAPAARTDPARSFARSCLVNVLQASGDVLAVPLLAEELVLAQESHLPFARDGLEKLGSLICGKVSALTRPPARVASPHPPQPAAPEGREAERDRWREWWRANEVEAKVKPLWGEFLETARKSETGRKS